MYLPITVVFNAETLANLEVELNAEAIWKTFSWNSSHCFNFLACSTVGIIKTGPLVIPSATTYSSKMKNLGNKII